MDLGIAGKTSLVTGASTGIGRSIALTLAAEGVRLAIVARRRALLEEVAREISDKGGAKPVVIEWDLMREDAPAGIAKTALDALGSVDILVNNAGGSRPLPVDAPDSDWDEAIALNFTRYRQVTHALLPQMIERRWGRVINITGKSEPEGLNAAFAAKAAVHAWAKGLSREIGRHGITVNCIPPGRIMSEQIRRKHDERERQAFAEDEIPVGRYGEPEELARVARSTSIPIDTGERLFTKWEFRPVLEAQAAAVLQPRAWVSPNKANNVERLRRHPGEGLSRPTVYFRSLQPAPRRFRPSAGRRASQRSSGTGSCSRPCPRTGS
jgi:3-oxoacyl-[acyl-carrier protein] reductase